MDRLQLAIEKARAQRQEVLRPTASETAPAQTVLEEYGAPDNAWATLTPMDIDERQLRRGRLTAITGGPDAAPFDLLRTRMLQQARANGWRRIAIVSPLKGCGKTTTTANLIFACRRQSDLRTLVLDLDLRWPSLAKTLGQTPRYGMEDVLLGDVPFARHGQRLGDNVIVGLNSKPASNPSELLQSKGTLQCLVEIEEWLTPDVILMDMPPMLGTDENHGFLTHVDAALLVVAAEKTSMQEIEVSLQQLGDLTRVMGIVLNQCRHNTGAYGYYSE